MCPFHVSFTRFFLRRYFHFLHTEPLLLGEFVGKGFPAMAFGMFAQMIGARKRFWTEWAFKWSFARMETHVTRQLIGTLKFLIARGPSAHVRRFAGVRAHMRG